MKNRKIGTTGIAAIVAALLSMPCGFAFADNGVGQSKRPLTPEMAAKREMVRKQQEQRITPEKRKAAAEALKAERIKIHKAKQASKQITPVNPDIK